MYKFFDVYYVMCQLYRAIQWLCLYSTGDESWPFGCSLRFVCGEQFGPHGSVSVDMLQPGEMTDVSIEMTSPSQTGIHQGQWRMCTAAGLYFGGKLSLKS